MSRRSFLFKIIPKNTIGAELGVYRGFFTKEIIKQSNPIELHLIDYWIFGEGMKKNSFRSQEEIDLLYEELRKKYKNQKHIIFHRQSTDEAVKEFKDNYFDWIYIDANHKFDGVYGDLTNYYPKVKNGGLIIGDDFGGKCKGVKPAVEKFCIEKDILFNMKNKQYWFEKK